jgi:hypothetical protein
VTEIVVERSFDPPISDDDLGVLLHGVSSCLALHKVEWRESLLVDDGRRMFCRFSAPDAESVRLVLHHVGASYDAVWAVNAWGGPEGSTRVVQEDPKA